MLLVFREPYYWAGRCDLDAVVVLVEVETDEGISGYREVTGGYPPAATEAALGEIAELLVGRSPLDIAGLCAEAYHLYGLTQAGTFANLIVGAVEMALWDIMGKALDQPVHRLLGGSRRAEVDYFAYEICRQRAADVLVLSPHETGGLLPFRKAAAIAEAAGIAINLHGRFVTGVTDLSLHYAALTLPNLTDGNQIMHQILKEDIVATPDITPRAGRLGLYERPGLGFELDQQAVERAAELYRRSRVAEC